MVQNDMTTIRTNLFGQHKRMATLLGSFYSPGMRFFPEGDPDPDPEGTPDPAKEAQEKHDKELDVLKQNSHQHETNAAKQKERADNTQAALENVQAQQEADKTELADLRAKLEKQEDVEAPEINADDYEEAGEKALAIAINKNIKALTAKIKAQDKQIDSHEKTKTEMLKQQKKDKVDAQRKKQYDEILDDFDKDYGHEHRNAAVNAFNKLVEDGKVPAGTAKATRTMEKCYKDAVKEAKKKKGSDDETVVLDTGSGGGSTPKLKNMKLKKGSLDDVADQVEKALTD